MTGLWIRPWNDIVHASQAKFSGCAHELTRMMSLERKTNTQEVGRELLQVDGSWRPSYCVRSPSPFCRSSDISLQCFIRSVVQNDVMWRRSLAARWRIKCVTYPLCWLTGSLVGCVTPAWLMPEADAYNKWVNTCRQKSHCFCSGVEKVHCLCNRYNNISIIIIIAIQVCDRCQHQAIYQIPSDHKQEARIQHHMNQLHWFPLTTHMLTTLLTTSFDDQVTE